MKEFCKLANKPCRTEEQAEAKAAQRSIPRQPIRAYKCEFCNYWHLTSQELRENILTVEPQELDAD